MQTTRKHPRTLMEAFPKGAEYGCAITRYDHPTGEFALDILGAVLLALSVIVPMFLWLS